MESGIKARPPVAGRKAAPGPAAGSKKNAVERRLDRLKEHYEAFLDKPDAGSMVNAFLTQQTEGAGGLPDFFMRFEEPFQDPKAYGAVLLESLRQKYESTRETLVEEDLPANWNVPPPQPGDLDATAWVRACLSFYEYYDEMMDALILVLTPDEVADPVAWQSWLFSLLKHPLPEKVRFLVLDRAEAPALDRLGAMEPTLIVTQAPRLNMAGAIEEVAEETDNGTPGAAFRLHFVKAGAAIGKKDKAGAQAHGEAALAIAKEQGWPDLQFAAYVVLGAGYLAAEDWLTAYRTYEKASEVAELAAAKEHPAAPALRVQGKLSEGSALFYGSRYLEAARIYEEAVPLADQAKNPILALEGWRMASLCYDKHGQPQEAWRCGAAALQSAEAIPAEQRGSTTLAFVGQQLLQLTKRSPFTSMERPIRQRMVELIGPDWEKVLPGGKAV